MRRRRVGSPETRELILCRPFLLILSVFAVILSIPPAEARFWGTPNFYSSRTTIVHLDQWLYDDVERECAEQLNKAQVAAVLVSEHDDIIIIIIIMKITIILIAIILT